MRKYGPLMVLTLPCRFVQTAMLEDHRQHRPPLFSLSNVYHPVHDTPGSSLCPTQHDLDEHRAVPKPLPTFRRTRITLANVVEHTHGAQMAPFQSVITVMVRVI